MVSRWKIEAWLSRVLQTNTLAARADNSASELTREPSMTKTMVQKLLRETLHSPLSHDEHSHRVSVCNHSC
eukprot:3793065-Amphidinium_carterae.1